MKLISRDGNKITVAASRNNFYIYRKIGGVWFSGLGFKVSESRGKVLDNLVK